MGHRSELAVVGLADDTAVRNPEVSSVSGF